MANVAIALSVIAGIAVGVWALRKETADTLRRLDVLRAFESLRRWACRNGYTVLFREQVQDGPFAKSGRGPLVFRVVVQDESGERRWGWVRCGSRLDVTWAEPGSVIADGPPDRPMPGLYDPELDRESST